MRSHALFCALSAVGVLFLSSHVAAFATLPLALRSDGARRCAASSGATSLNMGSGYFLRPSPRDAYEQDNKNEEIAFKNMISNLKNNFGREGFRGEDAVKHINIMENVEQEVESEEKKFLGSRRLYKFTKAATKTLQRPMKRKNHPGEEYRASRH